MLNQPRKFLSPPWEVSMEITCPACDESKGYPTVAENFEGELSARFAVPPPKSKLEKYDRPISVEEADTEHT
jgi:hypothetical protein